MLDTSGIFTLQFISIHHWTLYIELILCSAPIYIGSIFKRAERIMDVKSVCLGILTHGEASGYDIKKCFESSFGHFFMAGFGSSCCTDISLLNELRFNRWA